MKLSGAHILWRGLVEEGVDTVFGISGGAVIHLFHALPEYPIHFILMRHEQGAAHAADGYARATGKLGVCIATSGPGATNLVTGIATAYMDSAPMLAITGQVPSPLVGKDAFQETDITGVTLPITKHNYLVTDVEDVAMTVKEAVHVACTGRPGPVLIDITKDAQAGETEYSYPDSVDLPGYKPTYTGNPRQIRQGAALMNKSERPVILAGRGINLAGAHAELLALAEKAHIPVATTLLGKSCIPEFHELCLGMEGMHGEAFVNRTVQDADLIVAIGMRFSDRVTGNLATYAPHAQIVHIDLDPAEIGKNVPVDLPIVGDAKQVLTELVPLVEPREHTSWLAKIAEWREDSARRDILNREFKELLPPYVIRQICEATDGQAIMVSDVGQNQMWEAQYYCHNRLNSLYTSGGLGTMGFALPAAIGAQVGSPGEVVWATAGDGGFQMNIQELATIAQEKLPIKVAILNNGYLGMVRQWQQLFFEGRYSGTPLLGPDFAKVAEAYSIRGITVTEKDQARPAIEEAMAHDGPVVIDFRVVQEENVYPMVPAGGSISDMIRRPAPSEMKGAS